MTCQDAIAILAEYLEATLPSDAGRELEAHLGDCPACVAYLNTYRRTRDVTKRAAQVEMPEDMKERLRAFLVSRLGAP